MYEKDRKTKYRMEKDRRIIIERKNDKYWLDRKKNVEKKNIPNEKISKKYVSKESHVALLDHQGKSLF